MIARLERIDDIAQAIKTFWFKPERPVHYTAGQFTELYLPHRASDNRGERRWFTLSSSPTEPLLSITTKFAPEHGSTFKRALLDLEPGAEVHLADPMGDFVLPKDKSAPLLFVAGGMGITPMHSMIKYLIDAGEQRDITLLYGVRDHKQLIFSELFEQAARNGVKFYPMVEQYSSHWKGETGALNPERVITLLRDDLKTFVYLSGPEPLIEKLTDEVETHGVAKHRIVTDFFPGYSQF